MYRFWPAVGLFLLLFGVSLLQAWLLRTGIELISTELESASIYAWQQEWEQAAGAFDRGFTHWEKKRNLFTFVVNQTRVSELAVQWKRTQIELNDKENSVFQSENAVLSTMFAQLLHDNAITWYNIL